MPKLITEVDLRANAATCPECGEPLVVVFGRKVCRNVEGHADGLPVVERFRRRRPSADDEPTIHP